MVDFSALGSFDFSRIGGVAVVIGIVIFFGWFMRQRSIHNAEYGRRRERRLEQKEGLGPVGKAFIALVNRSKQGRSQEGAVEKIEKGNKAAVEAAKTAESEKKVEEATEALGGRGVGMLASVKAIMKSVEGYLARVRPSMQREEQDVQAIENLMRSLNNTTNFGTIDNRVTNYLRQIFGSMLEKIRSSVEDEHEKETYHTDLVTQFRDAVKEAREVIKEARTALNMLQRAKRKERRNFRKEINDILKAIKNKNKELSGIRKSKNVDPIAVAKLREEIALMKRQIGDVEGFRNQLQNTYRTIDREAREMKRLIKAISQTEKQVGRHEKSAAKREKEIEDRYMTLSKFAQEIEKSTEGLAQPYDMAIQFSGKLNIFYEKYLEIVKKDLEFDEQISGISLLNTTICMQMEAYEKMSVSLNQTEGAVEKGLAAATSMVAAIVGGQDQRAGLANLVGEIKKAGGDIDYATRVEQFLLQFTVQMEAEERKVNAYLTGLINEDNRLLQVVEAAKIDNSSHIGNAVGTMVNRKVQIDEKYMSQFRQFEQQLKQKNNASYQAYRQVRGLEARRTPVLQPAQATA